MSFFYRPVSTLAGDIREGRLSSREAVTRYLERIRHHNPSINAVVWQDEAIALKQAEEADAALARGEIRGPLHGVPMTVKDCFEVVGMPTTAGSPRLRNHRPARHADAVQKVVDAGAIVLGHTNVPLWASDLQSYNAVYGRSNNPWNVERTPGGSSGGAAAALAAGLTPIEIGSDIGGSIRTPAHDCGVLGHKPSTGLISLRGHVPGPPGSCTQPDLAEAGPMARHVDDLELLLDILSGPPKPERDLWRPLLPPCPRAQLSEFRVAWWFDDPACPTDAPLQRVYGELRQALSSAGCTLQETRPGGLQLADILPAYFNLLGSVIGATLPPAQRLQMRVIAWLSRFMTLPNTSTGMAEFARGACQSHARWLRWNEHRQQLRYRLDAFFQEHDILLCPIIPTTAIRHDTEVEFRKRTLRVNGQTRPYSDQMCWIALATLLGLPATSMPIGLSADGMPVNVQIIGAAGHDRTTLHFARLLEQQGYGFRIPPGYADQG